MTGAILLMGTAAIGAELAHRRVRAGCVPPRPMQVLVAAEALGALFLALRAVLAS